MNMTDADRLFKDMAEDDDQDAFRVLFLQFFSPLCVFANRYVEDKETCEDIVQDTFMRIWEKRKGIFITSSFRNFIVTSVRNSCIDYLRKQELENNWVQWRIDVDSEENNGDIYTLRELQSILKEALSKVPENIRTTFEMNRFEGKKYAEIAELKQISVKTVESHICKVLKYLRTELKDFLPLLLLILSENQQ